MACEFLAKYECLKTDGFYRQFVYSPVLITLPYYSHPSSDQITVVVFGT